MELNVKDICDNKEIIKDNIYIFNHLDCSNKKRNNIKTHLCSAMDKNNMDDSQLIMFQYILKQELQIQKLQLQDSSQSADFKEYIKEMKQSIESSNKRNYDRYEKVDDDCRKHIAELGNQCEEISELLHSYKEMIGVYVPNFMCAVNDYVPEMRLIHNKRKYLYDMNILNKEIEKAHANPLTQGFTTMRLKQAKQEILKNKQLDQFR